MERAKYFEACLPIEVMASRGMNTLAFGPLRPVGLTNPHTGRRPYAVVQLRQDNQSASLFNLVGFQTNLTYTEQKRVFRMIPGLEKAEFARLGQMHRNTYIYSPDVCKPTCKAGKDRTCLWPARSSALRVIWQTLPPACWPGSTRPGTWATRELLIPPETSMLGSLCRYIATPNPSQFQPMKANFGILPPIEDKIKSKPERFQAMADRALLDLRNYLLEKHEI